MTAVKKLNTQSMVKYKHLFTNTAFLSVVSTAVAAKTLATAGAEWWWAGPTQVCES